MWLCVCIALCVCWTLLLAVYTKSGSFDCRLDEEIFFLSSEIFLLCFLLILWSDLCTRSPSHTLHTHSLAARRTNRTIFVNLTAHFSHIYNRNIKTHEQAILRRLQWKCSPWLADAWLEHLFIVCISFIRFPSRSDFVVSLLRLRLADIASLLLLANIWHEIEWAGISCNHTIYNLKKKSVQMRAHSHTICTHILILLYRLPNKQLVIIYAAMCIV